MADGSATSALARRMHRTLEPYHAMIYFAAEAQREYEGLGLASDQYFKGYFASRAAALGPVPGGVVVATFFNFHPSLVHASIPSAWEIASPSEWQAARQRGADAALRRLVGDELSNGAVDEAVALARHATEACNPAGRALFAAHASLDWPDEPHLELWHAVTLLREFRGDGHITCLLDAELSPCEALVLYEESGQIPRGFLQPTRLWSDDEWVAAKERLQRRGWLDARGAITPEGSEARERVEVRTDDLAMAPWRALGEHDALRLRELVRPLSKAIVANGGFLLPIDEDDR